MLVKVLAVMMSHLACRTATTVKLNECSRGARKDGDLESTDITQPSVLEALPAADDEDAERHASKCEHGAGQVAMSVGAAILLRRMVRSGLMVP